MKNIKAIAVVGLGAILPDAINVASFWNNILNIKDSIGEVPPSRWNTALYYDPDSSAVDKTYSKIGAFVNDFEFDPVRHGMAIPPRVLSLMDIAQQWGLAATHQALKDYGYPAKTLNKERVAVILGNANSGEGHYRSTFRILLPEYLDSLQSQPEFQNLSEATRKAILSGITRDIHSKIPMITEDTMPGELGNIIAGRIANMNDFAGPNFITDAACASSLAALQAAVDGLENNAFDAVITGGVDRNMGPESYIKFCKIGALSAEGSRPYSDRADGFVMGEGAAIFLLKRMEDAERDGDKIYALIRGIGASADGKGKGITAPNPLGQRRAIERAMNDAGISPDEIGLIEGHGTSTKVGDVAELSSLNAVFGGKGLKNGSIALGSVKSNIGHLKSAAGAVGLLKTILALYEHMLPPSANFEKPNPNIDFRNIPFAVNTQPREWGLKNSQHRYAGVSSFGFGGTNFHVILEEYLPGILGKEQASFSIPIEIRAENTIHSEISPKPTPITIAEPSLVNADRKAVEEFVMSKVCEKTGYPLEMLELDLDLEADLGIDTVKQAELFAVVRTNYGIPRREDLHLSDYNTLKKVVGFVCDALENGKIHSEQEPAVELKTKIGAAGQNLVEQETDTQVKPYQGLYFIAAETKDELQRRLTENLVLFNSGDLPKSTCPANKEIMKRERLAIDYENAEELIKRCGKALSAMQTDLPATWGALQAHGIYRGSGKPGKVVFMFPGQGSQYVNMIRDLRDVEPVVRNTFLEADEILTPILGKPLTSYIYAEGNEQALAQAEKELKNTTITQPALLTANVALLRLMTKFGFSPDFVIGHSLGEYAALVASGVLSFSEALEVVSARGREMASIKVEDPGCMAAVSAPLEVVEKVLASVKDYIVIANVNSPLQSVLGGTTAAVDSAIEIFQASGFQAVKIPVSHAFHTKIVAPAGEPLRKVIERMDIKSPGIPIVANVTGEIYPNEREEITNLLAQQVASPVQFVKSMQTLYDQGARIFVEVGPKRVLNALATDNLKSKGDVVILATNHPRKGGQASFNEALCGLYAAGVTCAQSHSPSTTETTIPPHQSKRPGSEHGTQEEKLPGSMAGSGLPGQNAIEFDEKKGDTTEPGGSDSGLIHADDSEIQSYVLNAVSEKTGYPIEMLDLDLDLEADLGIDTVKQAELFATVRTHYGIPKREDLRLADYHTLAKVIGFVKEASTPVVSSENLGVRSKSKDLSPQESFTDQSNVSTLINVMDTLRRRIPQPVLLSRIDLCMPTGVMFEGGRVLIISGQDKVAATLAKQLEASKIEVFIVQTDSSLESAAAWIQKGPLLGVYCLTGLDSDPKWDEPREEIWKKTIGQRMESLFHLSKAIPVNAFLISATRMGGFHGFMAGANPIGGAVSGFTKAYSRERTDALVKVVDFEVIANAEFVTKCLIQETLHDPASLEVGREGELRFGISILEQVAETNEGSVFPAESVFVVSGGTGGITGTVVEDLARRSKGSFYLLSRTSLTDVNDLDLIRIKEDRNGFRRDLIRISSANGKKFTPVQIEEKIASLERGGSTLELMQRIKNLGGKAAYIQCDVTDQNSVFSAIEQIAKTEDHVNFFIHAAGSEKSHKLESKSLEEFRQIVEVKASGFFNLFGSLEKVNRMPESVVFFSSIAGRFGNAGQTDYSAGNDFLSKMAYWLPTQYPSTRFVSIDWGAWAEIGMASRGSIPMVMERAGIEMLKPIQAARIVGNELLAGYSGEVVIAGSLGLLDGQPIKDSGLDVIAADAALQMGTSIYTMPSHLAGYQPGSGITFETNFDPQALGYLQDHAINGTPLFPGVIGIEGFMNTSKHLASIIASDDPGYEVERLEKIEFLVPIKFHGNKSRIMNWKALAVKINEGLQVRVSLESDTERKTGKVEHTQHFKGIVCLTLKQITAPEAVTPPKWGNNKSVTLEEIYRLSFHGPSFQVLEAAQRSGDSVIGKFNHTLFHKPVGEKELSATSLLIELCFQTASLWEVGLTGFRSLPKSIGELKVYKKDMDGTSIYAKVQLKELNGLKYFDACVLDSTGNVYLDMTDYRTSPQAEPAEARLVEPTKILLH
ncbi:MAG: SDR family NAD(P)-dependent oxidoreductase [Chloroflexi bacterium]|nr:SDR family NAD(P)-dependent oxidoreductase [Chloroflexota bacterium]